MEQSPSWEACSHSSTPEIHHLLWYLKVTYPRSILILSLYLRMSSEWSLLLSLGHIPLLIITSVSQCRCREESGNLWNSHSYRKDDLLDCWISRMCFLWPRVEMLARHFPPPVVSRRSGKAPKLFFVFNDSYEVWLSWRIGLLTDTRLPSCAQDFIPSFLCLISR
jgi:hypothetical protein